jgi:cytochrome c-type biogenesis protein CcmH
MKRIILGVLIVFFAHAIHANTLYPLETTKQDAQFNHLLKELRCLVCQNQDLADSNAGLAKDLRNEVYQLVKTGKSDNEIIQYLTARYGDFILFKPPVKGVTVLLWFGPALFLGLGLFIFWHTCLRRRQDEDALELKGEPR